MYDIYINALMLLPSFFLIKHISPEMQQKKSRPFLFYSPCTLRSSCPPNKILSNPRILLLYLRRPDNFVCIQPPPPLHSFFFLLLDSYPGPRRTHFFLPSPTLFTILGFSNKIFFHYGFSHLYKAVLYPTYPTNLPFLTLCSGFL